MKRFLVILLSLVMLASVATCLSGCGKKSQTGAQNTDYISESQRQEWIQYLCTNPDTKQPYEVLAENVKVVDYDEDGNELISYVWTVNEKFSEPVGTEHDENGSVVRRGLQKMTKIFENSKYVLYMNLVGNDAINTTAIAIEDKATGNIFHSNPSKDAGADTSDWTNVQEPSTNVSGTSDGTVISPIVSPISIEAYDVSNKAYEFNWIQNGVEDLNCKLVLLNDNTIRVIYTVGNDPDKDLVPPVLTIETWDSIIAKMEAMTEPNEEGKVGADYIQDLKTCYKAISPDSLTPEDKERYLTNYPTIEIYSMYICRKLNTKQKKQVKTAMQAIGFTSEDLKKEMETVEYSGPERAVMFTIPVDITLTDAGLTVNVDSSLIQAPGKQKIYKIYLYRSMGSLTYIEKKMTDGEMYVIYPDGSGVYMPAKGILTTDVLSMRVYGKDDTFQEEELKTTVEQIITPFFVLNRANYGGLLAVLSSGGAQAFVRSAPQNSTSNPGVTANFDLVYAERDYRTYSSGDSMSKNSSGVVLSKEAQVVKWTVDYTFTDGQMTYGDYAKLYRDILIEGGVLKDTKVKDTKTPFFLELLGSTNKNVSYAGFPVDTEVALTSYADVQTIVDALIGAGVSGDAIKVRYNYWANGGYYNTIADKVKLVKNLGTHNQFKEMIDNLGKKGVMIYPSVEFLYVSKDKAFDSLNYTQDVSRRLDMRVGRVYERNLATGDLNNSADWVKYVLTPNKFSQICKSYEESYNSVTNGFKYISLGAIGSKINSNYKTGAIINRTQTLWAQEEILDTFADYSLLIEKGNDYTWKYADYIVNLPIGGSEYMSTRPGGIPFVQMILHGYISYTGEAWNRSGDYKKELLQALETGSGVYFRWMAADNTIFNNTEMDDFYSLNYNDSFEVAVDLYKEVSKVLDKYIALTITDHYEPEAFIKGTELPSDNVFATVYGDKYIVYVNYNSYDVTLEDGTSISAYGHTEVNK